MIVSKEQGRQDFAQSANQKYLGVQTNEKSNSEHESGQPTPESKKDKPVDLQPPQKAVQAQPDQNQEEEAEAQLEETIRAERQPQNSETEIEAENQIENVPHLQIQKPIAKTAATAH